MSVTSSDVRAISEQSQRDLRQRVEAMEFACAALWELLKARQGFTDIDLQDMMRQLDARDGNVDGKISHASQVCPHCGKKLLTRHPTKCSWCGGTLAAFTP